MAVLAPHIMAFAREIHRHRRAEPAA